MGDRGADTAPTTSGSGAAPSESGASTGHVPEHPLQVKHKLDALKETALQRVLEGKAPFPKGAQTAKSLPGARAKAPGTTEVPLEVEGSDRIFVILAEFGTDAYDDSNLPEGVDPGTFADDAEVADPQPTTFDGPEHNAIPRPNRRKDNSTLWKADYSKAHYEDMYFNRMKDYYEEQSSGRYTFDGDVTEWVKVPFNQALYGRDYCGDIVCGSTHALIRDAMAVWVQDQLDGGMTMPEIQEYLATFDIQDRYDIDGDNDFNEPDGFIDHFQIVHAGGDQAASDPIYGSDAIWSHRWYASLQGGGPGGLPGVNIGTNDGDFSSASVPDNATDIWVGDYTIQPENGGLGVFAHEYGHDLGLPDLYDTSGNTGGAENNTAFWTLMSSGANIGDGGRDGIGDDPTDMSGWELFQLGWLDAQPSSGNTRPFYDVIPHGTSKRVTLSRNVPATRDGAQAAFALLPDNEVSETIGEPFEGEQMFWSDRGDNLETTMTYTGVEGTDFTAQVDRQIEEDWDYAYLEASGDGGTTWEIVETNLSTNEDPNNQNEGNGITGYSDGWEELTATLPDGTDAVRFRYWTDVAFVERGLLVDQVAVDGEVIGTAEEGETGWEFDGFRTTTGEEFNAYFNAYVMENRQYDGYDKSLKTAYNFSFGETKPDKVESYPYQNGVLVWYWNDEFTDNNVGDHPGGGQLLPVDARPGFTHWSNGELLRNRILSFDSTFGLEKTDRITLKREFRRKGNVKVDSVTIKSQKAVPVFDDSRRYWRNRDRHGATGSHPGRYQPGWYSVKVPNTGTTMKVLGTDGPTTWIRVAPKG
ncbi:immune inhibitor A domain-containing protein [Nocardioides euryhalodurans]|uniref:immune inhibitor A domain-containing protein n=1 Tax=Nocardioides euryhalodurans TaxID=2518370 RepID=UPI001ABDCFAA|nr:immune inhibitor A domain-containing protein [Nocardioides euryhalodurans]